MQGAAIMGMNFHLVCPKELNPTDELLNRCKNIVAENGGNILITDNIDQGVKGSDVIYTDVWVSMGEPDEVWKERLELLKPYQVNKEMMDKTGNPNVIFEHCLPSFHNADTKIGQQIFENMEFEKWKLQMKYSKVKLQLYSKKLRTECIQSKQ